MRHCTCCDQMLPTKSFPREVGDCQDCCMKQFYIELFESPKSEHHLWKFRGWSADVFDTKSVLEEESEFLHIEVLKKNHRIDVAIKKRPDTDDEFQIWIGNKQFVVKSTKIDEESNVDCGEVVSTHSATDILDI